MINPDGKAFFVGNTRVLISKEARADEYPTVYLNNGEHNITIYGGEARKFAQILKQELLDTTAVPPVTT